ncbi:phage major capsid protein [Anaerotignum faecicola]|mgnify:FL=1|uniref:phage major capsid protein n=2 Tax=Anaerotignum faecicola TaxID=2358141 RepID=UPI003FD75AEF
MEFLKKMRENREEKVKALENVLNAAKTENRAMTAEEQASFDAIEKEIADIDKTIEAEERAAKAKNTKETGDNGAEQETQEELEERAFVKYVLGAAAGLEERAGELNLTMANNGAIVPTSIANKIIKKVKDISPILSRATVYYMTGELKVPVYGASSGHDVKVAYSDDFTELTADAGKFTSVDLKGYLVGALTLIGRKLKTNAMFNVTDFIVNYMAEEIAAFLEGELLNGTTSKMEGALSTTNEKTAAAAAAITADELIDLQAQVKQAFQSDACWIMHPETFTAVKKLKDGQSRYLLQDDFSGEFPYRLLGKPIFVSDNMPKIATGAKTVLYGDMSGLSVKIAEQLEIEVLREKYATQHAIGVVAWMEVDSKVTDSQRMAVLKMA